MPVGDLSSCDLEDASARLGLDRRIAMEESSILPVFTRSATHERDEVARLPTNASKVSVLSIHAWDRVISLSQSKSCRCAMRLSEVVADRNELVFNCEKSIHDSIVEVRPAVLQDD